MSKRGNAKGGELEREIAKFLNQTYNTEEFARTPRSGALMGLSNFAKRMGLSDQVKRTLGSDLITPDWFEFSVECKWYKKDPNHAKMIAGSDNSLDLWLGETVFDSINFELNPLLFFKTNNKGTFVAMPVHVFALIPYELAPKYYLTYNEFIVIGIEAFGKIDRNIIETIGREAKPITMSWLEHSNHVKYLIENLLTHKNKK